MADNIFTSWTNSAGKRIQLATKELVAGKVHALKTLLVDSAGNPLNSAGIVATATFTPAAAAYLGGDVMDVSKEFAFTFAQTGVAIPPGSLIRILTAITKIDLTAVPSGQTGYTLQPYSAAQPSAQADNDPWTLASADLDAYRGAIALGTPADLGAALYVKTPKVDLDVKLASGSSSLFGRLVTDGGFTATAVGRQVLLYGIVL